MLPTPPAERPTTELTDRPLSFSQMSTFLSCRRRWLYQYVYGIRPKLRSAPMEIGDAVHRGIASFFMTGDQNVGLTEWAQQVYRAIPLDDDNLMSGAQTMYDTAVLVVDRALTALRETGFLIALDPSTGVPVVEHTYRLPIGHWPGGFETKIDTILHDPRTGLNWVTDFKTRGYFTDERDETANFQNAIYHAAAAHNGIDVAGSLTFQIMSSPPKRPKLNKPKREGDRPEMSRADIACDWATYSAALIEAGLDPVDYADMAEKLGAKEFVKLTYVVRPVSVVEAIWNDNVEPLARIMCATFDHWKRYGLESETGLAYRNMSPRTCSYCPVQKPCFASLYGRDVVPILDLDFDYNSRAKARFTEG